MLFCFFLSLLGSSPLLAAISHEYSNENTPLNIIMLLAFPEELVRVKRTPQLRGTASFVSNRS